MPYGAWAVFKESKYGGVSAPYVAWFSTCAGNSDNGGGEPSTDNVKARAQRRRCGGGAVVGNPDLLTVPGVGPRNLRKLVEKGFEGVAQLKQLYKDKVRIEICIYTGFLCSYMLSICSRLILEFVISLVDFLLLAEI